jgi:hypothetical protein
MKILAKDIEVGDIIVYEFEDNFQGGIYIAQVIKVSEYDFNIDDIFSVQGSQILAVDISIADYDSNFKVIRILNCNKYNVREKYPEYFI